MKTIALIVLISTILMLSGLNTAATGDQPKEAT